MKQKFYFLLLSALFGIWGTQVRAQELSTTEIDGVTYYEIGSAADLLAFADLVNGGEEGLSANAVLTADIDLTNATVSGTWETPIGAAGLSYAGIFDGQGHKITGFVAECAIDGSGFFGYTSNATIKNFSIEGKLTSTAGTGSGVVGYPSSSNIYNVHSSLEITVPNADVHHVGGVVGSARGGNTISHCTFSGTMTVAAGSTDNFAGVVAYLGGDSVSFCANYGTISFDDVKCAAGGIAGYLNNAGSYVQNCLNIGAVVCTEPEGIPSYGGAFVGRLRTHDAAKLKYNAWLEGSAYGAGRDSAEKLEAFCFTEDQLSTGEVCYKLNGDQTVIGWYQTLGTDEQPVLDATHAQVYMAGRLHCNGDVYEGATFTNENTTVIQDEHNIVDGFCTYCDMFDENYLTPNADGFIEIATAKQLAWFEQLVNRGNFEANAVLTADIDFADLMPEEDKENPEYGMATWTPIGDWGQTRGVANAGYKGHFDGQGHTIKNFYATSKQNYFGLFGVISTDCLIENFTIYGTYYTTYQYAGGVAAYARDDRPTIRNIHSYVNINNSSSGGRQGGILGGVLTTTYKTVIENCTYSGTLDGNDAGGSGNYGGIVGYVNNNGNTVADITNCLFDGEVVNNNATPGGCTFGGFVGYSNGGVVTIKNSLSIGKVESTVHGQFFGAVKSTKSSLPNSYYMGSPLNGSASTVTLKATETNYDDLFSGEICWKLNEETFLDPVWRQTLNEEDYPVPYSNGAIVYQTPEGYACINPNDNESFEAFRDGIIANEREFINDEELMAYAVLVDDYKAAINSWEEINDYDEFIAAYQASFELKEKIKTSAASYAAYVKACEDAANELEQNDLKGIWADLLREYLNADEIVEPSTDFPNGNYAYIIENRNLDDEGIVQEIERVNTMLQNALAGGITAGTEITRLMANANFADGFEGWTTEADGVAFATTDATSPMPTVRGLGNGTFNVSQTLNEMPNGVYLMNTNGLFRAGTDYYSTFYAGQLYLNDTYNYVMSPGEDVISESDAEPGVNCLGAEGDEYYSRDGISGYMPKSLNGSSYAFNAGRYLNLTATEVTDGILTVGVRSLGTGLASDWMPFTNVRVWYLGTAEEADEKLDEVLAGYTARAKAILDFVPAGEDEVADPELYTPYPNISEGLKTRLEFAVAEVEEATTGEAKLELINTFSTLFNEVHACRKAYIKMLDTANNLFDFLDVLLSMDIISNDDYDNWIDEIYAAQDHFIYGDVSTEEAQLITKRLNLVDQMLPSVDGVYQLATVSQLQLFSVFVNNGQGNANAVLTNDIDLSELEDPFPSIGTSSNPFSGEFDGQNHKITGFGQKIPYDGGDYEYPWILSGDAQGFFGYVKNATIKNFSIEGAFQYAGGTGVGAVGWSTGSTLSNIHSSLDINVIETSHHIGGVCGHMSENSKAYNCSFSGIIKDIANTHDCIGGIGAYSNENCAYENCANYGTIIFSASNAYAGGICGYVNNDSFVGIFNCLNVGTIQLANGTPSYSGAFVGRLRSHANSKFENNYMLQGSASNTSGENRIEANTVTAEQLASGEICFKLNGGQPNELTAINWYQTLTTDDPAVAPDDYPVLFSDHKCVWFDEAAGIYTNSEPSSLEGDLNGDGKVDIADAVTVLNIMASGEFVAAADLNGDQKIDIADFVTVLNIMAAQ